MNFQFTLSIVVFTVLLGMVCSAPRPDHSLASELGDRGKQLDKSIEDIDREIVRKWDILIGPLSAADKAAFRRQYPDEAAEYDKITTYYRWPKKF